MDSSRNLNTNTIKNYGCKRTIPTIKQDEWSNSPNFFPSHRKYRFLLLLCTFMYLGNMYFFVSSPITSCKLSVDQGTLLFLNNKEKGQRITSFFCRLMSCALHLGWWSLTMIVWEWRKKSWGIGCNLHATDITKKLLTFLVCRTIQTLVVSWWLVSLVITVIGIKGMGCWSHYPSRIVMHYCSGNVSCWRMQHAFCCRLPPDSHETVHITQVCKSSIKLNR